MAPINETLTRQQVVERLRELAACKPGDQIPTWMTTANGWGGPLSELCSAAADLIEEEFDWPALQELRKASK